MSKKKQPKDKKKYLKYLIYLVVLIIAILSGAGLDIAIRPTDDGEIELQTSFSLHLANKQQPALIETETGEIVEESDIVTVEEVDGNQLVQECPEDEPECGLGRFIYAPTESPTAFKDYTIGKCWNTDGAYGAQC